MATIPVGTLKKSAVYGYLCGGGNATGDSVATTDRIIFNTGTIAAYTPANLTEPRDSAASISDKSVYGYIVAGYTPDSVPSTTSSTDRIAFSTSTVAAHTPANASEARYGLQGMSDGLVYGYVFGGYGADYSATTDRITFSTSTLAAHTPANLPDKNYTPASVSDGSFYGYVMGGSNSVSDIVNSSRITFSTSVAASFTPANLSQVCGYVNGLSDGMVYGYILGGYVGGLPLSQAYIKRTERVTFSTGVNAAHTPADLTENRSDNSAVSDGALYGYVTGGNNYDGGQYNNLVSTDKVTFSTGTTAAHTPSNLPEARRYTKGIADGAV